MKIYTIWYHIISNNIGMTATGGCLVNTIALGRSDAMLGFGTWAWKKITDFDCLVLEVNGLILNDDG